MLIKVKVKKSLKNPQEEPQYTSELLGTVGSIYKFNNLNDFQYLPIKKDEKTGKTNCIYDEIVPNDITAGPSWFRENKSAPVFLPPIAFTRTDTIQLHVLKNEQKDGDETADTFSSSIRVPRQSYGIAIPFDLTSPIPDAPHEKAKSFIDEGGVPEGLYENVKKLFDDQPIWTLSSIRGYLRVPPKRFMGNILAVLAFQYTTGPWRNSFVRFGYDPRKDPESRYYQTLDLRRRRVVDHRGELVGRRLNQPNVKRTRKPKIDVDDDIDKEFENRRMLAIFTEDSLPPTKYGNNFLLVDVKVPQVQELLKATSSNAVCDEKRGWIGTGVMDQCREIMVSIATKNAQRREMSFDLKSECTEAQSEMLGDSSENETFDFQ